MICIRIVIDVDAEGLIFPFRPLLQIQPFAHCAHFLF